MPITTLTLLVLAPLFLFLSFKTIQARTKKKISLGHGNDDTLQKMIRAHANFTEYVPFILLLILLAEYRQMPRFFLVFLGGLLILGRYIHAYHFHTNQSGHILRILGMVLTLTTCICGALGLLASFFY
ncbi:MAG: hypothetical protein RI911_778 [Candidatus Parcubacteria bacterium]|jgi:uncharacterized membrane protein YecN with MAPEG domain